MKSGNEITHDTISNHPTQSSNQRNPLDEAERASNQFTNKGLRRVPSRNYSEPIAIETVVTTFLRAQHVSQQKGKIRRGFPGNDQTKKEKEELKPNVSQQEGEITREFSISDQTKKEKEELMPALYSLFDPVNPNNPIKQGINLLTSLFDPNANDPTPQEITSETHLESQENIFIPYPEGAIKNEASEDKKGKLFPAFINLSVFPWANYLTPQEIASEITPPSPRNILIPHSEDEIENENEGKKEKSPTSLSSPGFNANYLTPQEIASEITPDNLITSLETIIEEEAPEIEKLPTSLSSPGFNANDSTTQEIFSEIIPDSPIDTFVPRLETKSQELETQEDNKEDTPSCCPSKLISIKNFFSKIFFCLNDEENKNNNSPNTHIRAVFEYRTHEDIERILSGEGREVAV